MTLTFSSDFRSELARVAHFVQLINYIPMVQVDFTSLTFALQEGESMSQLYDAFAEFCRNLATLDCVGLTLGYDIEAFEQVFSSSTTSFAPAHLTSLYAVTIPRQPQKMLDWLLHSLNNSPVHVIVIDGALEAILADATLPQLTAFTCLYAPDGMETTVGMVEFLGCHPSLTTIILGARSFRRQDVELVRPALRPFPMLESITASLDVLNVILGIPSLFPAMHEICIQGPVLDPLQGTREECFLMLSALLILISQTPVVSTLKVPFLNGFDHLAWNSFMPVGWRPEAFLTKITKLVFYGMSLRQIRPGLEEPLNLICMTSYFHSVEEVVVEDESFSTEDEWLKDLCSACPMVSHLVINSDEHNFVTEFSFSYNQPISRDDWLHITRILQCLSQSHCQEQFESQAWSLHGDLSSTFIPHPPCSTQYNRSAKCLFQKLIGCHPRKEITGSTEALINASLGEYQLLPLQACLEQAFFAWGSVLSLPVSVRWLPRETSGVYHGKANRRQWPAEAPGSCSPQLTQPILFPLPDVCSRTVPFLTYTMANMAYSGADQSCQHLWFLMSTMAQAWSILGMEDNTLELQVDQKTDMNLQVIELASMVPHLTLDDAVGLLDLPNEIILAILHDVDLNDLVSLAWLSQRLNLLALNMYLERCQKVSDSIGSFGGPGRAFSFLCVLRLCFFNRPQITSMSLHFSGNFHAEMEEVRHYVELVGPVPLYVDISKICLNVAGGPQFDIYRKATELEEFCHLLPSQDCRSLTCSSIRLPSHSAKLLDWLIRSMNASPLHTIVLEWLTEQVLERLRLPHLRNMTCIDRIDHDISLALLGFFLNRHPVLETLSILGHSLYVDDHRLLQSILQPMPHLTSLSANLNVLGAFFGCWGCFPALEDIGIEGPLTGMSGWFYIAHTAVQHNYVRDTFTCLAAVLALISTIRSIMSLRLPFLSNFEGNAWNMCIFGKDDADPDAVVPLPTNSHPTTPGQCPESLLTRIDTVTLFSVEGHPLRRDCSFDIA
ncbi:uncharacterized protein EV420DRAFT_1486991 [Desarmillaria tabescens]|uniref:F-box domain-containing protein n=1 Tax=Armillaria tabescens TaxID=1929756 RepID=A0AA39MK04_ARMTA|nr:uncharacterized protein EV420DRAFT_1486991 [Desarmillaria tabescens]KAK0437716.1 hypothetical protein EV420DRAFT_1486991 [Desarmillaria tabescens]